MIITDDYRIVFIIEIIPIANGVDMGDVISCCMETIDHIVIRDTLIRPCYLIIDTDNLGFPCIVSFVTATND